MTDQELLELAAKAGCVVGVFEHGFIRVQAPGFGKAGFTCWNPLADDGDALRLAISLGIIIDPSDIKKGRSAYVSYQLGGKYYPMTNMEVDDEEYAIRRLIVRAAAEIGKSMEKSQ